MACTPSRTSFQSGELSTAPSHKQVVCQSTSNFSCKIPAIQKRAFHGRGYSTSLNYFGHGNWGWSEGEWQGSFVNRTIVPDPIVRDFWDSTHPANTLNGTGYEEDLFFNRITEIVRRHDPARPLFLTFGSKLVHYPLQEFQDRFKFIDQPQRRMYSAMVAFLDYQVDRIVNLFQAHGLWDNTLMIMTADNGGYVEEVAPCNMSTDRGIQCFSGEAGASNYPMRGGKYYPFEGGIRSNAFVSGGYLPHAVRGTKNEEIMHISDWYSTFCALAGADPTDHQAAQYGLPPIDSLDLWPVLSGRNATSPRREVHVRGDLLVQGRFKVIVGDVQGAAWAGPQYPNTTSAGHEVMRGELSCRPACVFDLVNDPTEHTDIASADPARTAALVARLAQLNATIWHRKSGQIDPQCNVTAYARWGGFYGPWLEL